MPVLDQTTTNSYTGNGVSTVFAYTFKLLDQGDLLVEIDGVTQTLTTHYSVSGVGTSGGGNVTFVTAPESGAAVDISRDMAFARDTDYQENGDLQAETLDEDIDRVVMLAQQVRDQNNAGSYNFTQAGSSATTRTVQSKLRDVVSVMDFGATGDGVTDDTTAFINAGMAASGGVVLVPAGDYLLSSNVSTTSQFLINSGASIPNQRYITDALVDLADRDYECMMGMGYFNIWLEGTTFSSPASNTHVATLWRAQYDGTAGTFSVDQAGGPLSVGAYNGIRWNQTVAGAGSTYRQLEFRVEDGSTYNNGKATLSFLAQCETGTVACTAVVTQFFGSGGSPSADVVPLNEAFTATTSWKRFVFEIDMPSTSSKTFGSNIDDCIKVAIRFPATGTFNVALQEVKLERGPIRTPFSAIPLSLQHGYIDRYLQFCVMSIGDKATAAGEQVFESIPYKTEMRKAPTITFDGSTLSGSTANLSGSITANYINKYGAACYIQSAASGAYYAVGQLVKMDARI